VKLGQKFATLMELRAFGKYEWSGQAANDSLDERKARLRDGLGRVLNLSEFGLPANAVEVYLDYLVSDIINGDRPKIGDPDYRTANHQTGEPASAVGIPSGLRPGRAATRSPRRLSAPPVKIPMKVLHGTVSNACPGVPAQSTLRWPGLDGETLSGTVNVVLLRAGTFGSI
jgi:hypothetical protein